MKQYHDLLFKILNDGTVKKPARSGMPGTRSLFGHQFRHDLKKFPLLTTKKMFWKGVVVELLWFLRGDTNVKYLIDNGVNIWNQDAYNFFLKKCIKNEKTIPLGFDDFVKMIKDHDLSKLEKIGNNIEQSYILGDCGYQYGKVWRNFNGKDQIKSIIESLKKDPTSRRHIVSAIDPEHDNELALYWCHAMFQFNCREIPFIERINVFNDANIKDAYGHNVLLAGMPEETYILDEVYNFPKYYIDCQLYQRSADVFLGVPMNIASYALLTNILAKLCNMIPGDYIHSFGDVHIYDNHHEAIHRQLENDVDKYELPGLEINMTSDDLDTLVHSWTLDDFKLINYQSYPTIKAELSTGLVTK